MLTDAVIVAMILTIGLKPRVSNNIPREGSELIVQKAAVMTTLQLSASRGTEPVDWT